MKTLQCFFSVHGTSDPLMCLVFTCVHLYIKNRGSHRKVLPVFPGNWTTSPAAQSAHPRIPWCRHRWLMKVAIRNGTALILSLLAVMQRMHALGLKENAQKGFNPQFLKAWLLCEASCVLGLAHVATAPLAHHKGLEWPWRSVTWACGQSGNSKDNKLTLTSTIFKTLC